MGISIYILLDNKMTIVQQFFYEHPVFRYQEFALFKSTMGSINSTSVKSARAYYVKFGRIKTIRRKLYAVIGYHSALELFGVAYSSFGQLMYITQQKSKPFDFNGHWYQSVASPLALQKNKLLILE